MMANFEPLMKHSSELKKAQKKVNSLEVELKKIKENLDVVEKLAMRTSMLLQSP